MSRANSKSTAAASQALEPNFLSSTLANNELIRRLKIVTETLESYSDEDEVIEQAKKDIEHLADSLGSEWLMQHKNKDVRLLVAHGLADVLRIYAPDPPYTEDTNAAVIRLFLKILRGFESPDMGPDHPSYRYFSFQFVSESLAGNKIGVNSIHFFMLERLNVVSIFSIINELVHHRDELLKELAQGAYSIVGNMPSHKAAPKVVEHLTAILCCVIEEMESYEMDLFDLVVGALCKSEKKENPAGWNMMKVKAGLHPESELTNGERLSEAVYELSSIAPRVLTQILPAYAEDLSLEDATARIKAVKLLGAVFSVGNFHKDFALVFTEFKRRSLDKDPEVRKAMVNVVGLLLQKRPELSKSLLEDPFLFQGDQRDAPMYNLIVDHDERVRRDAIESVLERCLQNSEAVPLAFLRHIAERTLDRKTAVRQAAIEGLCKLYQKYCAPFPRKNLNASVMGKFWWIPTRVITLYRPADQELRVFLIRSLEDICLNVSTGRNPVHVAMDLYSSLDDKAHEIFVTIIRNKAKLNEAILRLHELRSQGSHTDLDGATEKEEAALFVKVGQAFQDSAKAQEMIRNLYEVKVQKVWEQLVDLVRKPKNNSDVQKVLDEILKRLGPKSALIDFVRQLVWCISDRFFGVDFVELVLRSLEDVDDEATEMAQNGLPLLQVLASVQPALFANLQDRIGKVLIASSENQGIAEHLSKVIAYAAEELDTLCDDVKVLKALNSLCFNESPDVAKFSARALLRIAADECKSLVRSCLGALDFGPNLPGIFAVLAEVAKEALEILKPADQSNIAKFAKKVLCQTWPASASGKKDKKFVANTRRVALKLLCSLVLGSMKDGKDGKSGKDSKMDEPRARELVKDLEDILERNGNLSPETVPETEAAMLRLTAGSCMLKIAKDARLRELLISTKLFFRTALLCEDEDLGVRRTFAKKLWKGIGLQQGKLPFHFTAMLVLGAHESDGTQLENVKTILKNILALMKRLRTVSGKVLSTIAPERILPWFVYLIAHHPSLSDAEEDDGHISVAVKKYLELFFNALTQAGTDEKIFPMLWLTLEHIKGCGVPDAARIGVKEEVVRRNVVITAEVGKRLVAKFGGQKKWDSDVLQDHLSKIVDASIFMRNGHAKQYTPALPDDLFLSPVRGKTSVNATPMTSAKNPKESTKDSAIKSIQKSRKKRAIDEPAQNERTSATRNMPSRGSKSAMRSLAEESEGEDDANESEEEPVKKKVKTEKLAQEDSVEEKRPARRSKGAATEAPSTPPTKQMQAGTSADKRANGPFSSSKLSPSPSAKSPQVSGNVQPPTKRRQGEVSPAETSGPSSPPPKSAQKKAPFSPSSQTRQERSETAEKPNASPAPIATARQSRASASAAPEEWKSVSPAPKISLGSSKPLRQSGAASDQSPSAKAVRPANKRARADDENLQGLDSDSRTSAKVTPPANAQKTPKASSIARKSAGTGKQGKQSGDAFDFDFDDDEPAPPTRVQPTPTAPSAKKAAQSKSPQASQASSSKSPAPKGPAPTKSPASTIQSPSSAKSAVATSPASRSSRAGAGRPSAKPLLKGRASASHVSDVLGRLGKQEAAKVSKATGKASQEDAEAAQAPPRAKRRRL